jgi:acyl-CoA reductase-like NAD-dependent aldehyde dehydrogenase
MASEPKRQVPMWIDNEPVQSDIKFTVTNQANGETLEAYGATPEIVKRAVDSSHRAFRSWRRTSPWERRELFSKAAQLLRERKDEAASILRVGTSYYH